MLFSPADSLIYRGTDTRQIEDQILKHYITTDRAKDLDSQLELVTKPDAPFKIYRLVPGKDLDPKPFLIPLRLTYQDETFLVFDARPCTRFDMKTRVAVVNNIGLYRREVIRSFFQALWEDEGSSSILRLGNIQIKIFATWISNTITSQFSIDAEQSLRLTIYCAYYYLSLFVEPGKLDLKRTARVIGVSLNLGESFVNEVLMQAPGLTEVTNIDEFINALPEALVTDRLRGLTLDLFIAKLNGSWFGPNNVMLIGIALEYPPMFITLVYLGLTDRSTKLARLAQVALRFERDKMTSEFLSLTQNLLDNELVKFQ